MFFLPFLLCFWCSNRHYVFWLAKFYYDVESDKYPARTRSNRKNKNTNERRKTKKLLQITSSRAGNFMRIFSFLSFAQFVRSAGLVGHMLTAEFQYVFFFHRIENRKFRRNINCDIELVETSCMRNCTRARVCGFCRWRQNLSKHTYTHTHTRLICNVFHFFLWS